MISVNDLRLGTTILYEGNLYVVLDFQHSKSARSQANVRTKLRNMRTGSTTEITFTAGEKVERAHIDKSKSQYLYDSGDNLVFMNTETYDQIEIPKTNLEWEMNFMKENDIIEITSYEHEILGVSLPVNVPLLVTSAEAAVKGDTATNPLKQATLETGFVAKVPMFITEGETIVVSTVDGKYVGRANN